MIDQASKAVCVVAAITSLIFVCTRTPGLQSSDLPVLALVVAPYPLLVLLAGSVGERSNAARVLFIVTLLLALGGTALLVLSTPHPNGGPEPGLAMTVTMIGVPLLQLGAVTLLGLVLLLKRMMVY
jgi:drug/metabolite transporter (DMT)-like permease